VTSRAGACQPVVCRCSAEAMMRVCAAGFWLFPRAAGPCGAADAAAAVPVSTVSLPMLTVLCHHGWRPGCASGAGASIARLSAWLSSVTTRPVSGLVATPPLLPAPVIVRVRTSVVLPPATAPPVRRRRGRASARSTHPRLSSSVRKAGYLACRADSYRRMLQCCRFSLVSSGARRAVWSPPPPRRVAPVR